MYQNLSQQLAGLGRLDESIAWGMLGVELSTDPLAPAGLVGQYVEFGDLDRARNTMVDIPVDHPLYELGDGINALLDLNFPGAVQAFEDIYMNSDNPRQYIFGLIAGSAVLAGDFEKARKYAELDDPDFAGDAAPEIDRFNVSNIIQYAFILQKLGEKQRAATLLAIALPVVRGLPRVGLTGHGIRDVQILALQGKSFEALTALREAIDAGFRGSVFSNAWPMAIDPYLSSLRGKSEYQAMVNEIDDAVAVMQNRVTQAEATGNWDALRALTDSS